jgi:hypothetical protein
MPPPRSSLGDALTIGALISQGVLTAALYIVSRSYSSLAVASVVR